MTGEAFGSSGTRGLMSRIMPRGTRALVLVLVTFGLSMVPVAAATPPPGNISPNIEFLSNLQIAGRQLPNAYSIAFINEVAFISTEEGIYSVDISDPTNPTLLGALPMFIYENEHMTSDAARNLIFISRDPRGFAETTAFPYGAIQAIDVSNPAAMVQVGIHPTAAGHTGTCINTCTYIWVGGPRSPAVGVPNGADPAWGGRPIYSVNVQNPANMTDCPHPIDLGANDGVTDYAHSIDVDANGVAWVSGSGHLRGFWTNGSHYNPVSGAIETATACDPIPYAGGGTNEGQLVPSGGIIHNSTHPLAEMVDGRPGDVALATEELITSNCATSGRFLSYDIGNSYRGLSCVVNMS